MSAHDRPDPAELLAAVREFLDAPADPQPDAQRERLHRKVASNVVGIVQRELASAETDGAAHAALLARWGAADGTELAALVTTITEDDPRHPALVRDLADWAAAKVRVVNPSYLEQR